MKLLNTSLEEKREGKNLGLGLIFKNHCNNLT
jgi:hypothetical protein